MATIQVVTTTGVILTTEEAAVISMGVVITTEEVDVDVVNKMLILCTQEANE